jgi:hypothetical protein
MAFAQWRWKVLAASVAGTSHKKLGIPCQDNYAVRILKNGALVVAVADGAGSAKRAEEGSSAAVVSAVEFLSVVLEAGSPSSAEECLRTLADCAYFTRSRIEAKAGEEDSLGRTKSRLSDFSTTLLAAFATGEFVAALQIGDGGIVLRETPGGLSLACKPEQGEYINETSFITSPGFAGHCQFSATPAQSIDALSLFSDGLQMLALDYSNLSPHSPFFQPLFSYVKDPLSTEDELCEFLESERICERSDDDKTLILAVRTTDS